MEKEGKLPDAVLACVGGGSNAIGAFYHFIPDQERRGLLAARLQEEVLIQKRRRQPSPPESSVFFMG